MSITAATAAFQEHMATLRDPKATQGLPTGIPDLDRLLGGGLGDGEVTTVFARTSIGKTSLILDMIQGFCEYLLAQGDARIVAFISAEMPGRSVVQRLAAMNLGIPASALRHAPEELIKEFLDYLKTWPLVILDKRGPELQEVKHWLNEQAGGWRQGQGRSPYAAIILDHVGKIQVSGTYDIYPKTSKVADATYEIAGYYSCPLIQAAQVNRGVEARVSRNKDGTVDISMLRPGPSDVEGSGKIEQNSDVMLALFRGEHYAAVHEQRSEGVGDLEINCCKNRNGSTGFVKGAFTPETTSIDWNGRTRPKFAGKPGSKAARKAAKLAVGNILQEARTEEVADLSEAVL